MRIFSKHSTSANFAFNGSGEVFQQFIRALRVNGGAGAFKTEKSRGADSRGREEESASCHTPPTSRRHQRRTMGREPSQASEETPSRSALCEEKMQRLEAEAQKSPQTKINQLLSPPNWFCAPLCEPRAAAAHRLDSRAALQQHLQPPHRPDRSADAPTPPGAALRPEHPTPPSFVWSNLKNKPDPLKALSTSALFHRPSSPPA